MVWYTKTNFLTYRVYKRDIDVIVYYLKDYSIKFFFCSITDQQIGTLLYRDIQYAFFDFLDRILKDCDLNPAIGRVPLKWEQPVYGDQVPNFTDFAAPGVILSNNDDVTSMIRDNKKTNYFFSNNIFLIGGTNIWCDVDWAKWRYARTLSSQRSYWIGNFILACCNTIFDNVWSIVFGVII